MLLVEQFLLYFLMIPLMLPIFVAVLASSARNRRTAWSRCWPRRSAVGELLAGKTLAGVIPAVIVTWISYILAAIGLFIVARPEVANVTLAPPGFWRCSSSRRC